MKLFKELLKLLKPFGKKQQLTFVLYLKGTTNFRELDLFLSFEGDGMSMMELPSFLFFFSDLLSIFFAWERSRVWGRLEPCRTL